MFMRSSWRGLVVALICLLLPHGASAGAATILEEFLGGLLTWQCHFTQSVVDAKGREVSAGSGELVVQRPGKFRWDFRPDGAAGGEGQLLVADGRNLWFLDRDLAQVTVKPLDAAPSATPMLLLSGSLDELHAAFSLAPLPRRSGFDWVAVIPRAADAEFSRAEVGFSGTQLVRMVVTDRLGQTATLQFTRGKRNAAVPAQVFAFQPPAGADVIGTPVQ